jgi:hypothetical protein
MTDVSNSTQAQQRYSMLLLGQLRWSGAQIRSGALLAASQRRDVHGKIALIPVKSQKSTKAGKRSAP